MRHLGNLFHWAFQPTFSFSISLFYPDYSHTLCITAKICLPVHVRLDRFPAILLTFCFHKDPVQLDGRVTLTTVTKSTTSVGHKLRGSLLSSTVSIKTPHFWSLKGMSWTSLLIIEKCVPICVDFGMTCMAFYDVINKVLIACMAFYDVISCITFYVFLF